MNLFAFWVARQFRIGRRKSRLVSFVSFLSTFSIAIGIAALIIGLSAMNGFERELRQRILTFIPDAEIFSANHQPLADWQDLKTQLLAQSPEILNVTPEIQFSGLLQEKGKMRPVQIQAIDQSGFEKLEQQTQQFSAQNSEDLKLIDKDSWNRFNQDPNSILIGDGLATKLNVKIGDEVTLMVMRSSLKDLEITKSQNAFQNPQKIKFKISGIIQFNGELGNYLSYIQLSKAQDLFNLGNLVTSLTVNVSDPFKVNQLIHSITIQSNEPLRVQTWQNQENGKFFNIYQDIQMIRVVMYLAMIVVIVVACFSIVSSLVIAVKDKQKEIAILKTMGASNRLIYRIFIYYGLISGGIGAFLGVILGVLVTVNLTSIFHFLEKLSGTALLNSDIYFINFVPTQIEIKELIIVFGLTLFISFLASFYPAKRATKINPVLLLKD